jgi:hypothetical protein
VLGVVVADPQRLGEGGHDGLVGGAVLFEFGFWIGPEQAIPRSPPPIGGIGGCLLLVFGVSIWEDFVRPLRAGRRAAACSATGHPGADYRRRADGPVLAKRY